MMFENALSLFKMDMGVSHNLRDTLFLSVLESCMKQISEKGITLDPTKNEDLMLLVDYALWQYRKRNEDIGMPRNLQLRIRNRVVKARATNGET